MKKIAENIEDGFFQDIWNLLKPKKTLKLPVKHVCISGGFDGLHIGHIRYIRESANLGTKLTVILNTDDFLFKKKGYVFMDFDERKEILESIVGVDEVFKCIDLDNTVCKTLQVIRPDIFCKGGDRVAGNIPEYKICKELGIKMIFGVGGSDKPQSSSWLVEAAARKIYNLKEKKEHGMRKY